MRVPWQQLCAQIMVASTTAFLVAGRFGLAPTVNKRATAGLKLVDDDPGVASGDPAGALAVLHRSSRFHAAKAAESSE